MFLQTCSLWIEIRKKRQIIKKELQIWKLLYEKLTYGISYDQQKEITQPSLHYLALRDMQAILSQIYGY